MSISMAAGAGARRKGKPLYKDLSILVLVAIVLGTVLGAADPGLAVAMQPLGTVFIKMIRAVIGLVIFFTVVSGIGSMQSMGRVGRLGSVALIYFIMSEARALMNMIGSGLAAPVLARMQGELDIERMHAVLDGEIKFEDYRGERNAARQT